MIGNPIARRELLSALRTRKAVAMQAMFLLATAVLVLRLWPVGGLQDVEGQQAKAIFGILAVSELAMVVLFAPAFTAAAVTAEKERNTFESLFATALRPWQIATGKIVGSLGFLVLVVVTGLPALATPFLLGGVSGGDLLKVLGVLLVAGLQLGMIGLLVSLFMHRSYRAIIVTYAVLLVLCLLVALPVWPVSNYLILRLEPPGQAALHALASLSPLQAMLSVVWPKSAYVDYAAGQQHMPAFWQLFIPLSCLIIAVTAAACLIKLRRPVGPPRPREKLKVVERGKISARTFLFLIDPQKRKRMIFAWQNPILIKEFRTRPTLQWHWLMRAVLGCLIASILLMLLVSVSIQAFVAESGRLIPNLATVVAAMMTVLILLIGPAVTAGGICADRENGTWDLIRMTKVPSWRIVSGKLQAAVIPLVLAVLAMLPALGILLLFNKDLWPNVVRVLYVVGMTVLFVSAAGMFFSAIFSRTATATAWTYAVVICIALLSLLVLLGRERLPERFVTAALVLNPVAAAMAAIGNPAMQQLRLVGPHLQVMGIAAAVMLIVAVARVFQLRQGD